MKRFLVYVFILVALGIYGFLTREEPLTGERLKAEIAATDARRAREAQEQSDKVYVRKTQEQVCNGCLRIKKDTFGCASKSAFDRVLTLLAQEDQQAANQAIALSCTILRQGTPVHTESYKFLSGEAQVRPNGSLDTLWIMSDTVSK